MNNMNSKKQSNYTARKPDANGYVEYSAEEHSVWRDLYERQIKVIEGRGCDEYIRGLELLNLPQDRIPQCEEVSQVLRRATGWAVERVEAVIPFDQFFKLLANRQFPVATFIRTREEIDYLKEPDIFHEVFGHCALLTDPTYANFVHKYGEIGLHANPKDRALIARLFWFTIEFGLVNTAKDLRIYGAGILSSREETVYALESPIPQRKPFNPLDALRTPYRYFEIQKTYFVLNEYRQLYDLINTDIIALINESRRLGEYPEHPVVPQSSMQDGQVC